MKKKLYSFLALSFLVCGMFFVFSPLEKASASEIVPEEFDGVVEEFDLKDVELVDADAIDSTLEFNTIEEFEAFLKAEEENEVNNVTTEESGLITTFAAGTKTYTYKEYTGVSTITSYAKVTRDSKNKVTKVVVWSSQTGLAFPIAYTQNAVDYTLNSAKTGGKAYVYGTKAYGVTVGGQGIAYKRNVTYTVSF
ncbi:hypothetical protein H9636_18855 [Ureibacillus sp. Re31]|uniref:DUF5626 domain-containing protein n=1 Tax=Ureibacillus galli TaxID=2762222 RepID=A0ABR8XHI3_9BACL|nr:hypothetical protein [Ureibacillus galli]MBD8028691.1 hypothetical protein [Ureibacillus galli]